MTGTGTDTGTDDPVFGTVAVERRVATEGG